MEYSLSHRLRRRQLPQGGSLFHSNRIIRSSPAALNTFPAWAGVFTTRMDPRTCPILRWARRSTAMPELSAKVSPLPGLSQVNAAVQLLHHIPGLVVVQLPRHQGGELAFVLSTDYWHIGSSPSTHPIIFQSIIGQDPCRICGLSAAETKKRAVSHKETVRKIFLSSLLTNGEKALYCAYSIYTLNPI